MTSFPRYEAGHLVLPVEKNVFERFGEWLRPFFMNYVLSIYFDKKDMVVNILGYFSKENV